MKIFRCDHCGQALFFENVRCLRCGSDVAFLPRRMDLCAMEPVAGSVPALWQRKGPQGASPRPARQRWRMCHNHGTWQACNFAVPEHDPNPLCVSCRQTRVLPDLSVADNQQRWYRIEVAKRRLFFTLARLGLVKTDPPAGERDGPVFEFLADMPGQQVMTGHSNGLITLNVVEADDAERVKRRVELHEPYRTLLGHLRHESGHYYWDRLIREGGRTQAFRAVFGDESADYAQALARHYASGGQPADWQAEHVSAYATAHPWEDWAETWAHYLHMVDLLETAASYGTRVVVPSGEEDIVDEVADPFGPQTDFEALVEQWVPVTLLVNSLNRSLGQEDAYPFALSTGSLHKLRFVHDVIHGQVPADAPAPDASTAPETPAASPLQLP